MDRTSPRRWRDRLRRLGQVSVVAIVVLLTALVAALQYLHLPDAASAVLAFGASLLLAGLTLWKTRQTAPPGPPATQPRVLEIDPQADIQFLEDLRVAPARDQGRGASPTGRPPYVERAVDRELRDLVREEAFVLLIGPSGAGKSRAAFEALVAVFPRRRLIVPPRPTSDPNALRRIADAAFRMPAGTPPAILWLDDIDDFLDAGALDTTTMADLLRRDARQLRVIGTIRSEQHALRTQPPPRRPGTDAGSLRNDFGDAARVLDRARPVHVPTQWSGEEAEAAREAYSALSFDPELGLGALLVGGPQLSERLALGRSTDPAGFAVALAAIDARRAGLARPLGRSELEDLWRVHPARRPEPGRPDIDTFADGLAWACSPTAAGISAIRVIGDGYLAVDYAVALRGGERPGGPTGPVPRAIRDRLLGSLGPDELLAIGAAAAADAPDQADAAWSRAARSDDAPTAAEALYRLGVLRQATTRALPGAVEAYGELDERFGGRPEPEIRELVAKGLFNHGGTLTAMGSDGAIETYDEVIRRYEDSPTPGIREALARSMLQKAFLLEPDAPAAAVALYDDVIRRFANDLDPGLRDTVGWTLRAKGTALRATDREAAIGLYDAVIARPDASAELAAVTLWAKGALVAKVEPARGATILDDVVRRYGGHPDPGIRQVAAAALLEKGTALESVDAEAVTTALKEVVQRFGDDPAPIVQQAVAAALIDLGSMLEPTDRPAALDAYQQVVRRFDRSPEPELLAATARARFHRADALGEQAPDAALDEYRELVARFADHADPAVDVPVAGAMFMIAVAIAAEDPDEALSIQAQVVDRYGESPDPELRIIVARTLANRSDVLAGRDPTEAVAIADLVDERYGSDPEPQIREAVAIAMFNKAEVVGRTDPSAAAAVHADILLRFTDAPEPEIQEIVRIARDHLDRREA